MPISIYLPKCVITKWGKASKTRSKKPFAANTTLMKWVVKNVGVTKVPIEMPPWQSPTHSKDSTMQRWLWTTMCTQVWTEERSTSTSRKPVDGWLHMKTLCIFGSWYKMSVNECERYLLLNYKKAVTWRFCAVMLFVKKRPNCKGMCVLSLQWARCRWTHSRISRLSTAVSQQLCWWIKWIVS